MHQGNGRGCGWVGGRGKRGGRTGGTARLVQGSGQVGHPVLSPVIDLKVQAAYDNKNLYWRFQWKTKNNYPGSAYPFYRFDGKEWKKYGAPRLDKEVQEGKQPAVYEDRLTIVLDDGKVERFKAHGCWLTCHDGMRDTAKVASEDAVKANPLLGQALKKTDV